MNKEDKLKKLQEFKKDLEKKFGAKSMDSLESKPMDVEAISTGSIGLDLALGVGGLPKGRIVELFGWDGSCKTTISLQTIANAQKNGGLCAFVDAENAIDTKYAIALGVDVKELTFFQPDEGGEQALNYVESLLKLGIYDVIVVDSVASLTPKAELEGDTGENKIGLHARMMSQAMRKLVGLVRKSKTCLIFTNQLREKIGVMFGCLHADMPIVFTDGRSIPIRKVVEDRIQGDVWCLNEETLRIEKQPIIDWHYNGDVVDNEDYLHIETESIDGGGRFGITVTPNHKLLTTDGWLEAKDVFPNTKLISKYESILVNKNTEDFIKGCLVGDSHLSIRNKNTACLKFQDSKNEEYCNWKKDILSNCINFKRNGKRWESEYTYEFAKLKREIENRNPLKIFKEGIISDLSLAIWIMDDGHYKHSHNSYQLSIKRFKNNKVVLDGIREIFHNSGIECTYQLSTGNFRFDVENSKIVANKIAPYLYSSMEYKLPINLTNSDKINLEIFGGKIVKTDMVTVLFKRTASNRQMRQKGKYDISIKDNHNYFSGGYKNGVLVHNSPETTAGGNALKFYASVRIELSKSITNANSIVESEVRVANLIRYKIIKNKIAPPFLNGEFYVRYGVGVDRVQELYDFAEQLEIINHRGKKITYGEIVFEAETKEIVVEDFKNNLRDNEEFFSEIENKVKEKMKK